MSRPLARPLLTTLAPPPKKKIETAFYPAVMPLASLARAPRRASSPLPPSRTSTTARSSPAWPSSPRTRPSLALRRSSASRSAASRRTISSASGESTTSRWRAGASTRGCSRVFPWGPVGGNKSSTCSFFFRRNREQQPRREEREISKKRGRERASLCSILILVMKSNVTFER